MVAEATNEIDDAINQALTILNQTVVNCNNTQRSSQFAGIKARNGCVVLEGNVVQEAFLAVDVSCSGDARADSDIDSQIKQQFEQAAEAINQAISASSSKATNITNLSLDLATAITNQFYTNCVPEQENIQQSDIDCDNSVVIRSGLKQTAVLKSLSDFADFGACQRGCGCKINYRQCYSNCGGQVITHRVCVAFCDKIKKKN